MKRFLVQRRIMDGGGWRGNTIVVGFKLQVLFNKSFGHVGYFDY